MDPLSVTASIITILTTAGGLLKALEQVRSRLNSNEELLLLMNSVTDVQATLITARDCANDLKSNKAAAAQRSYQELRGSVCRLQESLNRLVDFTWAKLLNSGKGLPVLSLTDGKKKKKLSELRESLTGAHRNLQTVLLSANLRFTPSLYSAVQEAVIIENDHYAKTSAKLEHIITQIASMQSVQSVQSAYHNRLTNSCPTGEKRRSPNPTIETSMVHQATSEGETPIVSQQVRITTSISLKQCEPSCICQCHIRTHYQTPRWLSAVVGTLFYSSTNTPALEVRPCNSKKCCRSQTSSSVHLTYHFPAWMMRTALVYSTWSNLNGTNVSWMVKMPRVLPETQACWAHILKNNKDYVMQGLQRRTISPWDVDPGGCSLFQIVVANLELDICSLLLAAGADWQFKSQDGWCPADSAWRSILMNEPTDPQVVKLKELLSSEDCYDLKLSTIHRIIVGLSSANLQDQLELDLSLINQGDWIGMTPLMWAALRDDHDAVRVLLSNSANVHLKSRERKTALHYAARSGSYECVKLLLDAGADPNACDEDKETPLYDAVKESLPQTNIERVISTLRDHGANLNADNRFGTTPILMAIQQHNSASIEALVKCGCNPSAISDGCPTALTYAVYFNEHECVQTLAKLGAQLSWTTVEQEKEDIFNYTALFATAETMNTLATSDAPAVPYNKREVMASFELRNPVEIYQVAGQSDIPPRNVDLAALENLLAKKGIGIDPVSTERLVELDDSMEESETDAEDADYYENAVENFVHPEQVDSIPSALDSVSKPDSEELIP